MFCLRVIDESAYGFHHIIQLLSSKSWVCAEKEGLIHDAVSGRELSGDAHSARVVRTKADEGGLANEIAAKEHTIADLVIIKVFDQFCAGERCVFFHCDFKAKP